MPIFLHTLPEAYTEAAIKAEQELTVSVQTATQMSHEEQAIFSKTEFHSTYTQTLLSLGNMLVLGFFTGSSTHFKLFLWRKVQSKGERMIPFLAAFV